MGTLPDLTDSLRAGVACLRRAQRSDGGFIGRASPDPQDFRHARHHPTIFFTALILGGLAEVPGTASIRQRAAGFLLSHKSEHWSWNYWVRGDAAAGCRPYPDDLDDTACALAALQRFDPTIVNGTVLAELANQLIATEVAPGGPYATWLVGREAPMVWRDVDVAVNANIGFLLSLQDVRLPGMERYLADRITRCELTSPYYVGTVPTIYFLARWYRGSESTVLRDLVAARLKDPELQSNPLMLALMVTAALNLDMAVGAVEPAVSGLLRSASGGSWPAAALYFEPPVEGRLHYAGSKALTTAFCLEALTAYQAAHRLRPVETTSTIPTLSPVVHQALATASQLNHPDLRRLYRAQIRRLAKHDHDRQISGMATIVARACSLPITEDALLHLNAGSLHGWVAYTIYDDFLDAEGQPPLLGVANVALRQTVASFQAALPDYPAFRQLVAETLACVDGANTWETLHARAKPSGDSLKLGSLPDYGEHRQLAERSWGHMLAGVGVLIAAGYSPDGSEVGQFQRFFHHFLIARQLNDDAHDWEEDLSAGRISAVVAMLMKGSTKRRIVLETDLSGLQQRFWEQAIIEVAAEVRRHTAAAREALAACTVITHPEPFERWLTALEQSVTQALDKRSEAKRFIRAYKGSLD